MARLSRLQKAERTLKLLFGMRIPRVAQELAPFGFDPEVVEEGWGYLKAVACGDFEPLPPEAVRRPAVRPLPELDAFENTWFPIGRRTLARHHPRIAERLFENLSQTRGMGSAISVRHFLDRIARMERGEEPFGAEGPAARRRLAKRGLTAEREAAAWALIDKLREVEPAPRLPRVSAVREEVAAEAMWAWYVEWSAVARVAIKNKTLLRALGFTPPRSRPAESKPQSGTLVTARDSRQQPRARPVTESALKGSPQKPLLEPAKGRRRRSKT